LDSGCPTGLGKVAGVKLEKHDEKLAGGSEWFARFKLLSGAINGIHREKGQKQRQAFMARWRDEYGRRCPPPPYRQMRGGTPRGKAWPGEWEEGAPFLWTFAFTFFPQPERLNASII
jgi:hypothetical protein